MQDASLFFALVLASHAHTRGRTQGRHDGRRHRCNDLHNPLNSLLLRHNRLVLVGFLIKGCLALHSRGSGLEIKFSPKTSTFGT